MYIDLIGKFTTEWCFSEVKHATVDKVIVEITYWSYVFGYIDYRLTKTPIAHSLIKFTRE